MSDLADRISRAAVAALDLAPFDDRYGKLSRQVLAGGASRFARVTSDDQSIHFVIPVGLAGERIDYGALVLQDRQAGIVWRDAQGVDHTATVPRGPGTQTAFSSLTLGGEQWMRFDVDADGEQLAFLVPPVNSPLLRSTLIDFFRARPGAPRSSAPMPEPVAEPPAVRFPDPEPQPEPTPEPDPEPEPTPEPPVDTTDADLESTQMMGRTADEWAPEAAASEAATPQVDDATRVRPALPEAEPEASGSPDEVDDATRVHNPPFDLYRDAPAVPPATPPAWTQQPTEALPSQTAPAQEQSPWAYQSPAPEGWKPQSAELRTVEAAPVYAEPSAMSRTVVGFLIGLFATLAIGGVAIAIRLLGA